MSQNCAGNNPLPLPGDGGSAPAVRIQHVPSRKWQQVSAVGPSCHRQQRGRTAAL